MKNDEIMMNWWHGLSSEWKENLYLNWRASLLPKGSYFHQITEDEYTFCSIISEFSPELEDDNSYLLKINEKISSLSCSEIIQITNLKAVHIIKGDDLVPLLELKSLDFVILNMQFNDLTPLHKHNLKLLAQTSNPYTAHKNRVPKENISIEQFNIIKTKLPNCITNPTPNDFWKYFYGEIGVSLRSVYYPINNHSRFDKLIDYLSKLDPRIKIAFSCKVRHYIISQHCSIVATVYINSNLYVSFFALDEVLFIVFLILHDIGKPVAFQKGNKGDQYKYTQEIIKSIWDKLPFDEDELKIVLTLLEGDTLGEYFQGKLSTENSVSTIINLSTECGLSSKEFFKIYMIYYQCDTASYTADAGGLKFLEHLFEYRDGEKVFDEEEGLIRFSTKYWEMYIKLKKEIDLCQ